MGRTLQAPQQVSTTPQQVSTKVNNIQRASMGRILQVPQQVSATPHNRPPNSSTRVRKI